MTDETRPTKKGQRVARRIIPNGVRDPYSPGGTVLQVYGRYGYQTYARVIVRWDGGGVVDGMDGSWFIVIDEPKEGEGA